MNAMTELVALMPKAAMARAGSGLKIFVTWAEGARAGKTELVDLGPVINKYAIYKPLRNAPELFATMGLGDDGHTIWWGKPDGDLEMPLLEVQRLAEEMMTSEEFRAFLSEYHLTQADAAIALGRSLRQVANYAAGMEIPRVVVLACYGYEMRLERNRDLNKLQPKSSATNQEFFGGRIVDVRSAVPKLAEAGW